MCRLLVILLRFLGIFLLHEMLCGAEHKRGFLFDPSLVMRRKGEKGVAK